jgi:hypothetical protein
MDVTHSSKLSGHEKMFQGMVIMWMKITNIEILNLQTIWRFAKHGKGTKIVDITWWRSNDTFLWLHKKIFIIFSWAIMYEKRSTIAKKEHLRCDVINVIENKWKWMGREMNNKSLKAFSVTKVFLRGCIIKSPWSIEWRWHLWLWWLQNIEVSTT